MNSGCNLIVQEGAHAGAAIALPEGAYLIGSDLDCDLVLLDHGVARRHLRLVVEAAGVRAERLADAAVSLHEVAVADSSFSICDGDCIRLGNAVLRLIGIPAPPAPSPDIFDETPTLEIVDAELPAGVSAPPVAAAESTPPPEKRRTHPVFWGLPLAVMVIGIGSFLGSRALQAAAPLRAPLASFSAPREEPRDELVARVREFLGDDGLDVQRDLQGRIVVSGKTRAAVVKQQLSDIRNEFKETIEIVDRVAYVSDNNAQNTVRLSQRITDIHVGAVRWFQTTDGMRSFEGSVLDDGAEVVRISIDGIVFRRNGKLAIFKLNDEERTK